MLWITGCRGLLGCALIAKCKAFSEPYVATGREVDISDMDEVRKFAKQGFTHIINCAAFSQVDAAEEFQEEAFRVNAIGPENLAIVANEIGANLIQISTDYVFPGKERRPQSEKDPTGPKSTYGKTKLEGEARALKHSACVIRTSWIFGNGGKNFVGKLLKMLQTQKEIRLTDDQWGRFTYAPDLAEVILKMLNQKGLFQFANFGITTKYEFGIAMREEAFLMGYPIMADQIISVPGLTFPAPCERPDYSAFDTSKIEKIVQIRHWRAALKEFLCDQMPAYL